MKGIMLNEHVGLLTATLNGMKTRTARFEFNRKLSWEEDQFVEIIKKRSVTPNRDYIYKNSFLPCYDRHINFRLRMFDDRYYVTFKPKYAVDEVVALKQSYEDIWHRKFRGYFHGKAEYKEKYGNLAGWSNKMFVKNDLMPHQVKITDIKLEQLQDISDEDCMREGIWTPGHGIYYFPSAEKNMSAFDSPRKAFAALVDYACGKGTWDRNDINVVYYYELVK